ISDSDLLVHLVDAANPRALQQIESVEKILGELELNRIPQIIVLNKADLLDKTSIEALKRQISLDKNREVVAISAIHPETIPTLIEKIGESLAKDLQQFAVLGSGS
ncbi:MAG TPA: ADP-ribosylation factor-like protein, partial [Pyrinomonadaceae bacterium]|nr:ADP-ribosylation factor-like protein [Pyrinomonadaceae bacterium]